MLIAAPLELDRGAAEASPLAFVEQAVRAEDDGFQAVWGQHFFGRVHDALTVLALAAEATQTIRLGVCATPTARRPGGLSHIASTLHSLGGGRLSLAIGAPGSARVDQIHRLCGAHLTAEAERYLAALRPVLQGRGVDRVRSVESPGDETEIDLHGRGSTSLLLGARSEAMIRVAGSAADGVITWLADPRALADEIAPLLRDAARSTDYGTPRIVAAMPVVVCGSRAVGRAAAKRAFGDPHRTFRRREDPSGGYGEAAADPLLVGPESVVEQRIREFDAAGVTEFWPVVLPVGSDESRSLQRSRELLQGLATDLATARG